MSDKMLGPRTMWSCQHVSRHQRFEILKPDLPNVMVKSQEGQVQRSILNGNGVPTLWLDHGHLFESLAEGNCRHLLIPLQMRLFPMLEKSGHQVKIGIQVIID